MLLYTLANDAYQLTPRHTYVFVMRNCQTHAILMDWTILN